MQYNSSNNSLGANVRLRWEYQPGSEFFVVYNEGRDTYGSGIADLQNRAVADLVAADRVHLATGRGGFAAAGGALSGATGGGTGAGLDVQTDGAGTGAIRPRGPTPELSGGASGDESAVLEIVRGVVSANPDAAAQYRGGKMQTFGFLVGQVMKASKGKANPKIANELLKKELEKR